MRLPLLVVLLLLGCEEGVERVAAQPAKERGPRAALVEVAKVAGGSMTDRWRFLGDVRADSRASLAAGAQGAVTQVRVNVGDHVQKGHLLVEVDSALARAQLAVAEANFARGKEAHAQAVRERERLDGLKKNVVAEVELERARSKVLELASELRSLEAVIAEARASLELHRVRAPFDGVVAVRSVDLGDWVRPGDPVLEMVSTGNVEVLVDASGDLLGYVKAGDEATIVGAKRIGARVAGVVPALDPKNRTVRIRLVPSEEGALLPGAEVGVEFSVDLSDRGVIVPQDALVIAPTETKVVKVDDGKARLIPVEIVARSGANALVSAEELSVGDQVVVRGNERLRPGQPLRVRE